MSIDNEFDAPRGAIEAGAERSRDTRAGAPRPWAEPDMAASEAPRRIADDHPRAPRASAETGRVPDADPLPCSPAPAAAPAPLRLVATAADARAPTPRESSSHASAPYSPVPRTAPPPAASAMLPHPAVPRPALQGPAPQSPAFPYPVPDRPARRWTSNALAWLAAERARAATTPLVPIPCPELRGITLLLKDESAHPSGSLKHRLARALFAHAIASGAIGPDTLVVEASSGSTAISEGWFARRLGLGFCAVVPATTAPAKLAAIRAEGGEIALAPSGADLADTAATLARERGGYFIDQFGRAAEASDWRGTDNIAAELLAQLDALGFDPPAWIVAGVGTGGTAATIGRHLRTRADCNAVRLCVVDPEGSAFFKAFARGDPQATGAPSMVVEGIGRARIGASFLPAVIDHMVAVADEGSVAGAHWLADRVGRRFGPSTGTNMIGALILGQAMARRGERGTILLLGGDGGDRYADTIYDAGWCRTQGVAPAGWHALLARLGTAAFPAAY